MIVICNYRKLECVLWNRARQGLCRLSSLGKKLTFLEKWDERSLMERRNTGELGRKNI